jgi:hypothetical protein
VDTSDGESETSLGRAAEKWMSESESKKCDFETKTKPG